MWHDVVTGNKAMRRQIASVATEMIPGHVILILRIVSSTAWFQDRTEAQHFLLEEAIISGLRPEELCIYIDQERGSWIKRS